jgi:RNA polymerase sigma-70 factor, ECF subfamily
MKSEKEALFESVLEQSKVGLYRVCRAYSGPDESPDDLLQDVLLEIWKSLDRFRNASSWNTFVYRIALNTAISHRVKRNRRPQFVHAVPDVPDADPDPTEARLRRMHACIAKLQEQDRALIALVLEDLSYKEIAEILDANVTLVGVRINRAKKKLISLMEETYGSV